MVGTVVDDMRGYYARRAATYERIYDKPERQQDLRAMEAWIVEAFTDRHVLEVACGTGWWIPHGARRCASWLATDVNPETLAIAAAKPLPGTTVRFATVDAYTLEGLDDRRFDAAFAGFWWSHVPLQRLPAWLESFHGRLEPGARVVFLDNRYVPSSSSPVTRADEAGNTYQSRTLDDGSVHEVLKNFPTREQAVQAIGAGARDPQWIAFEHYWILSYTLP